MSEEDYRPRPGDVQIFRSGVTYKYQYHGWTVIARISNEMMELKGAHKIHEADGVTTWRMQKRVSDE
jgi:hypothetical protein